MVRKELQTSAGGAHPGHRSDRTFRRSSTRPPWFLFRRSVFQCRPPPCQRRSAHDRAMGRQKRRTTVARRHWMRQCRGMRPVDHDGTDDLWSALVWHNAAGSSASARKCWPSNWAWTAQRSFVGNAEWPHPNHGSGQIWPPRSGSRSTNWTPCLIPIRQSETCK